MVRPRRRSAFALGDNLLHQVLLLLFFQVTLTVLRKLRLEMLLWLPSVPMLKVLCLVLLPQLLL